MQLRRVLLLFALVLGLSALVASLAPPPSTRDSEDDTDTVAEPARPASGPPQGRQVRLNVPVRGRRAPKRVVAADGRVSLEVSVPEPGNVEVARLGLVQSVDRLDPARFDFVAPGQGRAGVVFHPLRDPARLVGRLEFRSGEGLRRQRRRR